MQCKINWCLLNTAITLHCYHHPCQLLPLHHHCHCDLHHHYSMVSSLYSSNSLQSIPSIMKSWSLGVSITRCNESMGSQTIVGCNQDIRLSAQIETMTKLAWSALKSWSQWAPQIAEMEPCFVSSRMRTPSSCHITPILCRLVRGSTPTTPCSHILVWHPASGGILHISHKKHAHAILRTC